MAFLADDDVIVHRDAERLRGFDDRLRHLDIGAGGCRVARGVIVHQPSKFHNIMKLRHLSNSLLRLVQGIGICTQCAIVTVTVDHLHVH